ncbi:MAG: 2-hydroxychromene-2-carboxylate isomerase [Rubrivivax sp.]|nr:2-hydroxychromene-2-carboxylate isomerase [Rubrivivax sp.]
MSKTVDYYLAPQSPWTYLGHERLRRIVRETGATVRLLPVDLTLVFPVSGGLPLPKRAPQRQAYRLQELKRFSAWLELPLNLQPQHFPVPGGSAAQLIIAVNEHDGIDAAMDIASRVLKAVWAEERNIADAPTLAALLAEAGLAPERLAQSQQPALAEQAAACTRQAIDAGVFGAPAFVIDGELFWGQDRLDFVERKLRSA